MCVEEVPDYFVELVVPLDAYLKKMNCDPFFFLSNKTRLITKIHQDCQDSSGLSKIDCQDKQVLTIFTGIRYQ